MTTSSPAPDIDAPEEVVVTGGAGWLGKNLVQALGDRRRVRCLVPVADDGPMLEMLGPHIETVVGDVRDPAAIDRLFDGTSSPTVFHVAAIIHPHKLVKELYDVNVGGTEAVLDGARRGGANRFVHVSSNSPFGFNPSPDHRFDEASPYNPYLGYGKSKHEAEQLVFKAHEKGDVRAVVIRPPWFYGPGQPERQSTWFTAIRKGRFPMLGDGTQRRSMAYTDNLVHGLLRAEVAGAAPGNAYWIADREPYEFRTILATVKDALRAEGFEVSDFQPRLPRLAGKVAQRADALLQGRGRYSQALHVMGELSETIAVDITKAQEEIGYDPQVELFEGMRNSIRWCVEHGHQL